MASFIQSFHMTCPCCDTLISVYDVARFKARPHESPKKELKTETCSFCEVEKLENEFVLYKEKPYCYVCINVVINKPVNPNPNQNHGT
jgi:hypothetical protein